MADTRHSAAVLLSIGIVVFPCSKLNGAWGHLEVHFGLVHAVLEILKWGRDFVSVFPENGGQSKRMMEV